MKYLLIILLLTSSCGPSIEQEIENDSHGSGGDLATYVWYNTDIVWSNYRWDVDISNQNLVDSLFAEDKKAAEGVVSNIKKHSYHKIK